GIRCVFVLVRILFSTSSVNKLMEGFFDVRGEEFDAQAQCKDNMSRSWLMCAVNKVSRDRVGIRTTFFVEPKILAVPAHVRIHFPASREKVLCPVLRSSMLFCTWYFGVIRFLQ
ncbi:unnamed protein product, partial [Hapterophycus canaliculatus]